MSTTPLPSALKSSKCILHIDLDCFYCQVEQVRLGIPFDTPAAVQQWHALIAVNYGARKAGVAKITSVSEAKKLSPGIKLLHVATYGPNDTEPQYYDNPDRNTHKVSLDPYRVASQNIFKIFHKHCGTVQKIGSDEAFMDVTSIVNEQLKEQYIDRMPELLDRLDDQVCGVFIDWDQLGVTVSSNAELDMRQQEGDSQQQWTPTTWRDLQLALGAMLAAKIRKEVYDTLHYFCSAGVAHYKVVAKLCSSKNKPNKQTVLREVARLDFMRDIPFNKIRNLGGKLGSEVGTDLEILNAGEIWKYDLADLEELYGKSTGLYLYNICRGIDDEEVSPAKAPKSLMAAKSFTQPIRGPEGMRGWFNILSVELHARIFRHYNEFGTWPKNISIRYATPNHTYRSKSIGTLHKDEMKTHDNLVKRFQHAYNAIEDAYPCIGIDLVATGLVHDESSKSHTLNRFFTKYVDNAHDANGIVLQEETTVVEQSFKATPKKKSTLFFGNVSTPSPQYASPTLPISPVISEETPVEETFQCDRCKHTMPLIEIEEHSDYHFALDLQAEGRITSSTITPSTQTPASNKKGKTTNKKRKVEDEKKKLTMFFQPRSS